MGYPLNFTWEWIWVLVYHPQFGSKIIMDDTMIFTTHRQYFEDLANLFRALVQFRFRISPTKYQFFEKPLNIRESYIHVTRWKPIIYTIEGKCSTIIKLEPSNFVKNWISFSRMVNFRASFLKDLGKHLIPIYEIKKMKNRFHHTEEKSIAVDHIKELLNIPPVLCILKANDNSNKKAIQTKQLLKKTVSFMVGSFGTYWVPLKETTVSISKYTIPK